MITEEERKLIGNWELHGRWYTPTKVLVECDDIEIEAITEIIDNKSLKSAHGINYPTFLNDKQKMLNAARKDRSIQVL